MRKQAGFGVHVSLCLFHHVLLHSPGSLAPGHHQAADRLPTTAYCTACLPSACLPTFHCLSTTACYTALDHWHLAATEQLTAVSKSLLVALAAMHGRLGVADAIKAARLEELFQTEEWGVVEAGHDLDAADITSRIAAPMIFMQLLKPALGDRPQLQRKS